MENMVAKVSAISYDLRFRLRSGVLNSPSIGAVYTGHRAGYEHRRLDDDTDLVIDGYPRSANTFAWHAAQVAAKDQLRLAGHSHAASTIIGAAKRGLPCVLLLRWPDDAIASFVQLRSGPSISSAIAVYCSFHEKLLPYKDKFVVSTFEQTTAAFGDTIDQCNRTFGSSFPLYAATESNEAEVRRRVDEENLNGQMGAPLDPLGVARPSDQRKPKAEILNHLSKSDRRKLQRAQDLHIELAK